MVTIIYCRGSSEMLRPEGCGDQEHKVREYLLRNNIPTGEVIPLQWGRVFYDAESSGRSRAFFAGNGLDIRWAQRV